MDSVRVGKPKSDETRARILESALELFGKQGFEQTTMREIASAAGMATGAAYYYFESKDALVMAFYGQAQQEMGPRMEAALSGHKRLEARLKALLDVKFDYFRPNRSLLGALSVHTNPRHPLSPFSAETRAIRETDVGYFARALEGGGVRIPSDLVKHLPRVLWIYQMGLLLFWVYDDSAEQARTARLVEKSLAIVVRLIRLSGYPLMGPVRKLLIDLLETIYGEG